MAGGDLVVPAGPGLPGGATIPAAELTERFSRSPGPGGQSVNTSDTRVELLFDPASSTAFTEPQLRCILQRVTGTISVTASEHRSQIRNRGAARDRLVAILRDAVAPPPHRGAPPSRAGPPSGVASRGKKQRGRTKDLRGRVAEE